MRRQIKRFLKKILRNISTKSIQKRLGYPGKTKFLIIHADDLGLSASENEASFAAMEKGMVNSGSVMVPCPNFIDVPAYSKINPNSDIGLHLTITSEWPAYKFSPVLPPDKVQSIIDLKGYLFDNTKKISANADPDEVESEFRSQINKALESGIELTHIDSHMFAAFANNEILKKYIELGKEYKLPVLLTYDLPISTWFMKNNIVVDKLYCALPEDNIEGLGNYYSNILKSLKPGLNVILVHVAYNNKEMQNITQDQLNFGSAWRQDDYDFFTSNECRQLINDNNIQLITWREIRDRLL
jgi:predicted glycoside hydrolase/deacetylase ChbG (UPF0249 family)